MNPRLLEKDYKVHVYETGPDGKLSLSAFFDYLQDIASDHAVKLGYGRDDLMKKNHFWVLSRIYAEISIWPSWGDRIIIRTWPKGIDGAFALRDYEACFADGNIFARATSSWLIIDLDTKKIQRPENTLFIASSELTRKNSLPRNAGKLDPLPPDSRIVHEINVRISDLDINLHANNVKYLRWVTDSCDLNFVLKNEPYSAEINYLAESRVNDTIIIKVADNNDGSKILNSSLVRLHDNKELCRIRIGWKSNHTE
jgi:medium-chain acyl-[acyl-carrier-protein] hydrolase